MKLISAPINSLVNYYQYRHHFKYRVVGTVTDWDGDSPSVLVHDVGSPASSFIKFDNDTASMMEVELLEENI